MNYKTISEQYETFISILEKNKDLMAVLDYITELKLPNFYIAAGSVFQTIWNYYDGKDLNFGIKDIDVIYYNNSDLGVEKDLEYYNIINVYIKSKGFTVSMDDFGTGYSSLSMLQSMPIDILKIDKVFVDKADLSSNRNIINHIILIAKSLNVQTVIEGVETKQQVEFIKKIKGDIIQGYYYSKPMLKEEFEKYFNEHR